MKRRRRPVSTDRRFRKPQDFADTGPRERWQHSGKVLQLGDRAGLVVARATEEHVLDVLVLRGVVDERQRAAGFRFKLDYHRAGLAAHVTGSYAPIRSGDDGVHRERERNDLEEAAYQRWRNALRAVGMVFSDAVISTVCHDLAPRPAQANALRDGLERLAKYYGLPE